MWEIKSVQNSKTPPKPGNELKFIKAQFREAHNRNFKNPLDQSTGVGLGDMRAQTRVIISTRYRDIDVPDSRVSEEIKKYVGDGRYAKEAIWIDKDGAIRRYK